MTPRALSAAEEESGKMGSDCVRGDSFLRDRSLLGAPSSVGITAPLAAEPAQTPKVDHGFPISKNEDLCLVKVVFSQQSEREIRYKIKNVREGLPYQSSG